MTPRLEAPRRDPLDALSDRIATQLAERMQAPLIRAKDAPMSEAEMLRLARGAVRKIDRWGLRGVTLVSTEEITAMALTLACFGILPGQTHE